MKRSASFTFIVKILAVVMIATTLLAAFPIINASAANVVITLDPGHGGSDPGNVSAKNFGGNDESYDNWEITRYTKERLQQYSGVTVYLTRNTLEEYMPGLADRVNVAKRYNSDAIISIHTNSATPTAHGVEVLVPNQNWRPAVGTASKNCANAILEKYIAATGLKNRGLKERNSDSGTYADGSVADYYGIINNGKKQNIPVTMIIETAFASNQGDYQAVLATDAVRKRAGYAIADGIASYYGLSASGNLPSVDAPAVPTAPAYYSCVDHINGVGPNGTPNYNNINGMGGNPAVIDAATNGVPADTKLAIGGWMGVDGGTSHYVYSLDNGATWKNATGGYDGEPLPNHYAGMGYSNGTKMGMFHKDVSPIVADLSAYPGQKLTVLFAAVSAKDSSFVLPFLKVTNYTVSGTPAPSLVASCVDANTVDGADTADKSAAISVTLGQTVGLRGWAGYNLTISKFGYYLDGNSAATVWTTDPGAETEEPVFAAGGANARRYHIQANTAGLSVGTHSIKYVMQLSDGTVVDLSSYQFTVKATSQPEVTPPQPEDTTTAKPSTPSEPEHTCSFGIWSITKPATCTATGTRTRVCSCGASQTETIPVKGHTEGNWIVDSAAKPGVDGSKHIECTVCHLTLKTELIPALPSVTEPTVTTKEPETTKEPVVTEPAVTEPEATEPEATEPEATEPEATEPEATEPEATEPEATEPEATEPEATESETTEREPELTKPAAKPPVKEEGCKSTISGALAIVALATAAGALCLARKKED